MTPRRTRIALILGGIALLGVVTALVLSALGDNLTFFFPPSDVKAGKAPKERAFRLGGLVEVGSVKRQSDGLTVGFIITDNAESLPVRYTGLLPDLFREGKGVIAQGKLGADGVFQASEILAKHDENYTPKEVQATLQKAGHPGAKP